ncbi:hypothetical protein ACFUOZ_05990 [Paenarthrobacter sp. NPDC057355]|uniref:hypothetical protein n=1 Tax=Paenarthrobacter sp. NPDC057355 TaxID=3346105 RepID=UPI003637D07C
MIAEEYDAIGSAAAGLFDPALKRISLGLQLGGREAGPDDIAARLMSTLEVLEGLDRRPMEWLHVNYSDQRLGRDNTLPRTHRELALSVEDGARKYDAGHFSPSWGYYILVLGFLAGSARRVCPFQISASDGEQDVKSSDPLSLRFDEAVVSGREVLVDSVAALIDLWKPTRGGISCSAITKKNRDQPVWYPPVGVLTYFAHDAGYVLPEDPLVDLRPLRGGNLAVLKTWSLEAVQEYEAAFRKVNAGIPNGRASG